MKISELKNEIKRQLRTAKRIALPREKWGKNPSMGFIGAYHLGRQEALESIANKIDIRIVHELYTEMKNENVKI